jgi:hypothetical protein
VEDLRVHRPRNRPSGPSCGGGGTGGGGGARLIPQLAVELGAELRRSTSSVEDELLVVIGILGGGVRRRLLRVIRELREGLPGGLVARDRTRAISTILAQVSGWSAIVVCWPSPAAGALYKDVVGGK